MAEPMSATTGAAMRAVAIDLSRRNVDLHETRRRGPTRAFALCEKPVQARSDQHHYVGLGENEGSCGRRRLFVVVRQEALRHGHRQIWDTGHLDE